MMILHVTATGVVTNEDDVLLFEQCMRDAQTKIFKMDLRVLSRNTSSPFHKSSQLLILPLHEMFDAGAPTQIVPMKSFSIGSFLIGYRC
jgi:hypothetical protein